MPSNALSPRSPLPPSAGRTRVRAVRWIAVLVAVLALHWIAAQWVDRHRETFQPVDAAHAPVEIALLKPERIETQPAAPSAAPEPTQAPKPARAREPHEHVLTSTRPEPATPAVPQAASAPQAASGAATAASAASGTAAASSGAATASAPAAASAPHAASGVKFSVPPSGELQYDTFYNGVRNQPGTIHWTSDGQHYEMIVSMPVPFVGTFSYASHGRVDAFGLAPDQYVEKRGRRPEDVTIFNRADKQIAFTRTPTTLALPDGAQDRFSMVMQLASLVRGDPDAYKPGVTRQFYVADNDSGEIWPIETIGDETIRTQQGFIEARHFMRLPRHAGDTRRIDVWLAPSLGWLPARLVQTEPNGTQIELVWRGKLAAGADAGAGDASNHSADNAASSATTTNNNNADTPPSSQTPERSPGPPFDSEKP